MHKDDDSITIPIEEITKPRASAPVPIEVSTYDGHKASERPMSFLMEEQNYQVIEILFAWIEETSDGSRRTHCFEIVAAPLPAMEDVSETDKSKHFRSVIAFSDQDGAWTFRPGSTVSTK